MVSQLIVWYFSVGDNIIDNNPVNNTVGDLNKNNPLNYLYFAVQQSFIIIKLKSTTAGGIQKNYQRIKKSCGCDEITTKILKISISFIVSP